MAIRSGTGQGGKSIQDRELAAEVRKLALLEIKKALKGNNKEFKQEIILRLASSILPRLNEHSGQDGGPIPVAIYGGQSIQISRHDGDPKNLPVEKKN